MLIFFKKFSLSDKLEVIDYLVKLVNYKYSEILASTKHPRFEVNNLNKNEFCNILLIQNIIYDFTENNGYYSIQRKNPRKPKLFSKANN